MSMIWPAIIYLIGAASFMVGGYRLVRWILTPKTSDYPLKPHVARDTFVTVFGSLMGIALWTYIFFAFIIAIRIRMHPGAG